MTKWLIYKHTSNESKKSYVGMTKYTMEKRWQGHLDKVNEGSQTHFHNAIRLYGKDNWTHEVIVSDINDAEEAQALEVYYIKKYDTFENGYNLTIGGEGGLRASYPSGADHHGYGIPLSKEHKEKIRLAHIGKKFNSERKANISRSRLVNGNTVKRNFYNPSLGIIELNKYPIEMINKYELYNSKDELYRLAGKNFGKLSSKGLSYSAGGWYAFDNNISEVVVSKVYTFENTVTQQIESNKTVDYMGEVYGHRRRFLKLANKEVKETKTGWRLIG